MKKLSPSSSERMFALQWWKSKYIQEQFDLARKYRPYWPSNVVLAMVQRSTSIIVQIYREENK